MNIPEMFVGRILPLPEDENSEAAPCWIWVKSKNNMGYGTVTFQGKSVLVHRLMYELTRGPIESGLVVDHLCRNRACCNPDHLELVTQSVNSNRGRGPSLLKERHSNKTHCPQGHEYTPENTCINKKGARQCRTCQRNWAKIQYQNKKKLRY